MENSSITYWGEIVFDPRNATKKHDKQKSWKRVAMVMLDGGQELSSYYSWFIKNRFGFPLNPPLRGAHVTFVNDSIREVSGKTQKESEDLWDEVKSKYNKKRVKVNLSLDIRTDGQFWWFPVIEEDRVELQGIRSELGLGRPYFGMHMTIGSPNQHNKVYSDYYHNLLKRGVI